ncbi:MAG: hypothetical protein FJ291_32385 [Planctomycetes bacterium]|nr:hypothetical protein [Planctomycetota bacterium]
MDERHFYLLAEHLRDSLPTGLEEAAERTVAGRIYYAAFLYARNLMALWGCALTSRGIHAQVSEGLKCSGNRDLFKIGHKLAELHEHRRMADYETRVPFALDFKKLKDLYDNVHPELQHRWAFLSPDQKRAALEKMQRKISTYTG